MITLMIPFKKYFSLIFILCFLTLSLSGCGGSKTVPKIKRDGAPKYMPNLDKIPNAKPVVKPLSRYGNRFKNGSNVYKEKNRRYKVLPTSKGYKKRGHASWYGTLFHGRRTSSGERYNMYAMTAAHPTLPIPTYVKVTNLKNRKSVIVEINDRGPFRCNRIIDLSYVAAAKLDMLGKGTADVEVQSVDPRDHGITQSKRLLKDKPLILAQNRSNKLKATQKEAKQLAKAPSPKNMYLQMGSFEQKTHALELVQKIERVVKVPTRITENKPGLTPRFLVQIGPFKNHMEAIKLTQKLAQAKISCPNVLTQP